MSRKTKVGARELARRVLRRVRRDRAYANLVLGQVLSENRLNEKDRALVTELVYGVLRRQRQLDDALGKQSNRPIERLDEEVKDALRLGAYQLLHLDRIPAHAAVNDAVLAVRRARGPAMAGYANAILRRITKGSMPETSLATREQPEADLALAGSLPDWLARQFLLQHAGSDAFALALALLERAPLTLRMNRLRTSPEALVRDLEAEGARVGPGRLSPEALRVAGLSQPFESKTYLAGHWTAQDEAAQLVAHALAPRPGDRILDACAGVGGKATHLAALMDNRGEILCTDASARKLELLSEHCLRLSVTCCQPREGDLLRAETLAGVTVDRVLLDAPCSGLGVLRRHPELKWRLEPRQIDELAALQRQLLRAVIPVLRPGGVLVYSVCTTTQQEGPAIAAWLREQFPTLRPFPPDEGPLHALAGGSHEIRLWPHRHDCDGFYMLRLRLEA